MSSFEWNKIIASVLTAMIVAMVSGILASQIVRPQASGEAGLSAARRRGRRGGSALRRRRPAARRRSEPIAPAMAKADPKTGEQVAKVCLQCHTFDKGGANKIGPNLFGIMEENIAAVPNYQFSQALAAHKGEKWDPEKLKSGCSSRRTSRRAPR